VKPYITSPSDAPGGRLLGQPGFGIPARLRKRYGIQEGTLIIAEEREEGILLRPAVAVPLETYSPERVAEFLLTNAVDDGDYARAVVRVRSMGLDPDAIPHTKPE